MGKEEKENDDPILERIERIQADAIENVINAFNEGYYLGRSHAEKRYEGEHED